MSSLPPGRDSRQGVEALDTLTQTQPHRDSVTVLSESSDRVVASAGEDRIEGDREVRGAARYATGAETGPSQLGGFECMRHVPETNRLATFTSLKHYVYDDELPRVVYLSLMRAASAATARVGRRPSGDELETRIRRYLFG
jgi:hypothetical protein